MVSEENFRKVLINRCTGEYSKDDWKLPLSHNPHLFSSQEFQNSQIDYPLEISLSSIIIAQNFINLKSL